MKILTFVVPAYNSEQFLDKGIPSMLHPEILDKLEIIIVSDGSTDATVAVAEQYVARYPDTVRLIAQENKGHGGALNTGFAAATGQYIKPIDADDWVQTRNLPEFIRLLEDCSSDVVLTPYRTVDISNGEIVSYTCVPLQFGVPMDMGEIMENWRNFYRCTVFHGVAYRNDFYRNHGLQLSEHVFYEDNEYATFPFCRAETVTALDLPIYEYRIGDVAQSMSVANQIKRLDHLKKVGQRMLSEYIRLPDSAGKDYAAEKTQAVLSLYLNLTLLAHPDRKTGRVLAAELLSTCHTPGIHSILQKKHRVLRCLNYLHINKETWDNLLNSDLYNALRKKLSFH